MCGRYLITSAPEALRQLFEYGEQPNFPARYNVAPTQPVPVVIFENGVRRFRLMRWGLLPSWVKDPRDFALVINARAETVLDKPAFKMAMKRRRCLLPADGYYEWQPLPGRKQPHFIHRRDGGAFGFAGLAETWSGPNGEEVDTVAIVTAPASADLAHIHGRVPVTISPENFSTWLDSDAMGAQEALKFLTASPEGTFNAHPVSSAVNKVANDEPKLIAPISVEELAAEEEKARMEKTGRNSSKPHSDDGQGSLF